MSEKKNVVLTAVRDLNESFVRINRDVIAATKIPKVDLKPMASGLPESFRAKPETAIAFIVALNSLNYMFWSIGSVNGKKSLIRYSYDGKVGAIGMRAAFDKLWGDLHLSPTLRHEPITPEFIRKHFGDIPDPESRATLLSEVFAGERLEQLAATLYERISTHKVISADDAALLHQAFPRAFADSYMKRSQLAMCWIAGFFAECGLTVSAGDMTAFADYQVPRVLRSMGVLEYSSELAQKVDSLTLIDAGSPEERAIRGATIIACEELADANDATAGEVDNYLWPLSKSAGTTPFHLTFTEHY
jgi:hypothetical protein